MRTIKYPRGSEWRKWDLHVHSPHSALNNGFGDDFGAYARELLKRAAEKEIAAIGITDYFCIEGYNQLRRLLSNRPESEQLLGPELQEFAQRVLIIPNVEFRASVIVRSPDGNDKRVNFHVLFSDELEPQLIEDAFLREIKFTAEASPGGPDEQWSLTIDNLKALGRRLKDAHANFRDRSDLAIGMTNAVVSREDVVNTLERQASRFRHKYLIVFPASDDLSRCSWDGQGHLPRKLFVQGCSMLFSSNEANRQFGLGRKHSSKAAFLAEFRSLKPCIHGSDAHTYESLFEPEQGRYLWIKAAPTFQGLRQLLYEPESRVHIGREPDALARVRRNPTRYMNAIRFSRVAPAQSREKWFSGELPLNHGLVAIIGNKGSGKSALADIVALLGDSRASAHFSFLKADRFLDPKAKLAQEFLAELEWKSGSPVTKCLRDKIDPSQPESVKYIPQNYLEAICADLKGVEGGKFYSELMEVIYSHVSDADRLGKSSLVELLEYQTTAQEEAATEIANQITALSSQICSLEENLAPENLRILEARLVRAREELRAHDESRPVEVRPPTTDGPVDPVAESASRNLAEKVERASELDASIANAMAQLREHKQRLAAGARFRARIANVERELERFHEQSVEDAATLGVASKAIVKLVVEYELIEEPLRIAQRGEAEANAALDPEQPASLVAERAKVSRETDALRNQLDEPNRLYQEYLHQLARWEGRRREIEGGADQHNSIGWISSRLDALGKAPAAIKELESRRQLLVKEVFAKKLELLEEYRRLYAPVQEFIAKHPVSEQQGALEFFASISVEGVDRLLEFIHQGRRGSFQGEQEGRKLLTEIVRRHEFSTEAGVMGFLAEVREHLETDRRDGQVREVRIADQLKQSVGAKDVLGFLYGLEFLRPRFELRWRGKTLDQLSPGERGSLLLVFYLLIDKRDMPLVVDQPEENLDNQTIAQLLVPAVKFAKERRQIVMVTHNPNLAVVCDADQVIQATLDRRDGNRVDYFGGGIEERRVAEALVDILEGTKDAFDLRDAKYEILDRAS